MLTPSESSEEAGEPQCPLCMEVLEPDDVHFYPCTCGYQVCLFCWHRLRTDGNGRCPACRQDYGEDPVSFKPSEKVEKRINEKAKAKTAKPEAADLSAYRVLQMNLIYVTGLSPRIADVDTLKKNEYFGQFGKILKLSITNGNGGSANLQSACAYVTYSKSDEALRAILSFHNTVIDGRNIKVSLGTTKYCASFLRSQSCSKTDCSYCHEMSDMEISFTAEDMQAGKHSDYEKRLLERFERSLARQAQRQAILAARKVVPTQNPKPEASVEPRIDPPPPAVIAQPSKVEPRVPVASISDSIASDASAAPEAEDILAKHRGSISSSSKTSKWQSLFGFNAQGVASAATTTPSAPIPQDLPIPNPFQDAPRMRDPFDFDRFLLQQQLGLRQHSLPSLREPYIPQLTDQCKLDPESRAPGSPIRPPPGLTNVPLRPPGLNSFFSEAPKRPEPPLFIATRDEDILARHREAISCSSSNWQSLFGFNSNEARMKEHQEQQQQHAFDRLSQEFDRRMPMPIGTRRAPPLAASTRGLPDFFALDMPLPPGLPLPLLPPPPGFLFPLQRPRASAIDSFFSEQRAPDHSVFARQDEDLLSRHREAINNSSSNWQSLFGFRTSGVPTSAPEDSTNAQSDMQERGCHKEGFDPFHDSARKLSALAQGTGNKLRF